MKKAPEALDRLWYAFDLRGPGPPFAKGPGPEPGHVLLVNVLYEISGHGVRLARGRRCPSMLHARLHRLQQQLQFFPQVRQRFRLESSLGFFQNGDGFAHRLMKLETSRTVYQLAWRPGHWPATQGVAQ